MTNSGLTASDVMALTKDNDGFGGVGLIILLFIFLIGLSGNGFGFGNNGTGLALADIQASLYNQTQDSNSRALSASLASVNDTVLNNKYDNAVLIKDLSNQMSNSIAGISNQIANQTATITNLFNEQTIDRLREFGYDNVFEVNFNMKSADKHCKNKRAEMWWKMAEWIRKEGALPQDDDLVQELTNVFYGYSTGAGQIQLEGKELVKKRIGKSPDLADALALTFAFPIQKRNFDSKRDEYAESNYQYI